MVLKFLKHRWQRVTAWVLLTLTALVLILSFFVNLYWSPILASKVKDVVLKSSDSLYTANFSSAELHILRGTIVIFNITLKPDTAVYNRRNKQHLAPNNLVELHVKRLILSHIHPFKLYFQHKLEIGEIAVDDPVINVSYQLNHTRDTVLKQHKTAWQKISKSLHSIHIGAILLGDIKLTYKDYSGNKLAVSEFKEMNLSANDLLIDSATQTDTSRLLYCREIIAELNNYTATSPNGLYTYKFNHLKLSTRTSQLNIEGLSLKPVNTEEFFHKSNRDRFTLRLDSIQLNHFDFLNYHKYRIINVSNLILNRGSVEIFGNPNHFQDSTDKIKSYPGVGLSKINADMKIDTALVRHIDVFYSEYNKKSDKTGTISFNNTNARFLNITTNPAALQKNNISTVQLTSYFMNRGKLNLEADFNLTDKNNAFTYKGMLGTMDLKAVNAATMPLSMVKITSGTLKKLSFDIKADGTRSRGKVILLYNNLKVVILKADTVFDNLKRRPIESLFANLFIVKHNNPDVAGGMPRSFYVNGVRERETPFFKFMWQTLLSGIKPAIGLDKKTEDTIVAMKSNKAIKKQNRKIKKEERIKRREARRERRIERKLLKNESKSE
jgi:hypothetical protein